MMAGLAYFVSEAALSLWRGRRASLLAILTIAAALFVLGVFLLLLTNVDRVMEQWRSAAEFSVYLRDEIAEPERRAIEAALRGDPAVAAVEHVSKDAARERFSRDFPDLAAATDDASRNPFPASIEVRLKAAEHGDRAAAEHLASRVARMPGVSDVRYDRQWLDRLERMAAVVRWLAVVVSAVLVLAAALTVGNVVRLALHARREEIEIMALVGAPMAFIRGPFIVEGLLQGALGALVAIVALALTARFVGAALAAAFSGIAGASTLAFLPGSMVAAIGLGGILVGCVAGWFATRRVDAR